MYEINPKQKEVDPAERKTRLIALIASVVVILIPAIILGVWAYRTRGSAPSIEGARLENAIRPDSPEFAGLREGIFMDRPQATEATRALGDMVMTLQTTLRNFTGRTITGLEMRAMVVDLDNNPVKERTTIVLPSARTGQTEIEPNNTLPVQIMLEGIRQDAVRANIRMEITAIRVR
jgi:hypothetical protein